MDNFWSKTASIPSTVKPDYLLFKYLKPEYRIIDVGCGNGNIALALGLLGYSVTGVDINQSAIERANQKAQSLRLPNVNFITADICNSHIDGCYDIAIMNAFMTTLVDEALRVEVLRRIRDLLRNNGLLYIADFLQNYNIPLYRQRYEEGISCGLEKGTFYVRDSDGNILYLAHHFESKEIMELVINTGYKIIEFEVRKFKTRSGNPIDGFVLIAGI
ncbi:MAG: class I SAM-dependent methyltransferase [Thermodesulfovibrionales bacterium]|nr:class I SAM-dependent methyltransferase [Thermodesulfovibrionales bacterium]